MPGNEASSTCVELVCECVSVCVCVCVCVYVVLVLVLVLVVCSYIHTSMSVFYIHTYLNERVPLLDQRPELVGREVHAVEVGEHVLALDVLRVQLDLPVR